VKLSSLKFDALYSY